MITTGGKVRDTGGFDENIGIDDAQLVTLIQMAENKVKRDAFSYHEKIVPSGDPDTGALWNGTNTAFKIPPVIADHDFDETTADDVTGTWLDSSMGSNDCSITVTSARYGYITIKQDDESSAIPASAKNIHVDYYSNDEDFPFITLEDLGTYWVCHLVQLRLTEPRKISFKEFTANKRLIEVSPTRFKKVYEAELRDWTEPMLKGT